MKFLLTDNKTIQYMHGRCRKMKLFRHNYILIPMNLVSHIFSDRFKLIYSNKLTKSFKNGKLRYLLPSLR